MRKKTSMVCSRISYGQQTTDLANAASWRKLTNALKSARFSAMTSLSFNIASTKRKIQLLSNPSAAQVRDMTSSIMQMKLQAFNLYVYCVPEDRPILTMSRFAHAFYDLYSRVSQPQVVFPPGEFGQDVRPISSSLTACCRNAPH